MLTMEQQNKLLDEIQKAREEIKPDNVRLSIGEVISYYKAEEIILNPNFQRVFRWSLIQKSRLIESILLGIPLPPIFVSVDKDSIWTVIDGVQRLSSILQFTGYLDTYVADNSRDDLDDAEESVEQNSQTESSSENLENLGQSFQLTGLKKLKNLNGVSWQDLGSSIQRLIKRHFLDIVSISTVKYEETKFEMFQRLNTGGSQLSDQEKRNCLIIMKDETFYDAIRNFVNHSKFTKLLTLKNERIQQDYHIELLLRFLIAKAGKYNLENYSISYTLMKEFIDDEAIALISNSDFDINKELRNLDRVSELLYELFDVKSFKKNGKGSFNLSKFEAVLVGIAINIEYLEKNKEILKCKFANIEGNPLFENGAKRGRKALERFDILNKFSKEYFLNEC
ncbi:DUF262 domain-containing protein [Acinetobacter indicus]|uniref:DUF262 domain-containing protein n=1 Tax=Acinetobacter indicus TaxID=756892 RepID=UPI0034CE994E